MCAVTASVQPRRAPSPLKWWPTLLVFGLLVGLVGMHGLALGESGRVGGHHSSASEMHLGMPDMWGRKADSVCLSESGVGGGHAQHADATCASGALSAGTALPALLPAPPSPAPASAGGHRSAVIGLEGGRAPPSLSALQLLRI
ncbi:DUF6153 family protein [Streptomyces sp. YIM S03343]